MSGWDRLRRFLEIDPADAGCAETFRLIDAYVERALAFGDGDAEARYPAIAAHLLVCGPCAEDYRGLRTAVGGTVG